MRRRGVLAVLVTLAWAAPASASQLITIDTPSAYVDPAHVTFNADGHPPLRANVLLPDGFDPARKYPVLFLLHGAGDTYDTWSKPGNGDIAETVRGLDAIVVMPEAAIGFYTNAWNDGRRGDPAWERFYLDELIPLIERRFPIRAGRRWHAIAGLSMGGMGATFLGGQRPGYFGSIASFSGFVEHQRATVGLAFEFVTGQSYEAIFGPMDGFYADGHNPTKLVGNLTNSRVFVAVGDGIGNPAQDEPGLAGVIELEIRQQNDEFVPAARAAKLDLTYRPHAGVHAWPYWRSDLREAVRWGLFGEVPETPAAWSYTTVAQTGEAWGLRYSFAAPPATQQTLRRDGDVLSGRGSGTVTLTNAGGCKLVVPLPFDRPMLPSSCAKKKKAKPKKKHKPVTRKRRAPHRRS